MKYWSLSPVADLQPTDYARLVSSDGLENQDPTSTTEPTIEAETGATVSIAALTPFIRLLDQHGEEAAERFKEHFHSAAARWGLRSEDLQGGPSTRLPHSLVVQMCEDFPRLLQDSNAPARAALALQPGDYELLEYLCATTENLEQGIHCLGQYYPLLIAAELSLEQAGSKAEVRFRISPGLDAPDAMHEFGVLSNLLMTGYHMEPGAEDGLLEIHFAHQAPSHHAELSAMLPCPVHFGQAHNAFILSAQMLAQPMRKSDAGLHQVLLRLADHEMDALFEHSAFPHAIRQQIEATLPQGAHLSDVAERLHISPGALRSRLRHYGVTYSVLLDQYRRTRAKRALRQGQYSIAEVAHQLGFSHPPAFNRAFKRWFGVSPATFKASKSSHPTERLLRETPTAPKP